MSGMIDLYGPMHLYDADSKDSFMKRKYYSIVFIRFY